MDETSNGSSEKDVPPYFHAFTALEIEFRLFEV